MPPHPNQLALLSVAIACGALFFASPRAGDFDVDAWAAAEMTRSYGSPAETIRRVAPGVYTGQMRMTLTSGRETYGPVWRTIVVTVAPGRSAARRGNPQGYGVAGFRVVHIETRGT